MKNANMPAMPQSCTEMGYPCNWGNGESQVPMGLTKREMIAMHMSGHILTSLNHGAANGEWSYPSFEELANQSVQYADALLKELEK